MVDCNTLNLTRRGGRKGLAIGSGRGERVELDLVYLVPRSSDDGGKYSARCVIAGEPSLAHSRPVVNHQGGNFVVCHFSLLN